MPGAPAVYFPTTRHAVVVGQETPVSSAGGELVGLGLGTIVHELTAATAGTTTNGLVMSSAETAPIARNRRKPGVCIEADPPMGIG
jgi:hypothetical protein